MLNTLVRARALDSCSYQGVYCGDLQLKSPYRLCEPTGFAVPRREGTKRRVLIERLEV